ncbi:RNA ligase family protein [Paenibacillus sp. MMS20-IR301]|uniref:ATP-dependent DNA ligase n=1 Tax=Paenibacillus sp. MMS20-IR301 TaxID=2895946 RepID=UPI0028EA028D|nr:RNA ligase family protein [Paenibacillus sp. MMS20-IR301]WNS41236.1 RNA ligase family protein [Paenibacillus sp. MMS20-IR301]
MKLQPIIPFEPVLTERMPEGGNWIAQIKWDGVRMLSYGDGSGTELINRRGNRRTLQYPELADVRAYCKSPSVILDGEIIALSGGKPSFHEVMRRDSLKNDAAIRAARQQVPVIYMVFDILYCAGRWVLDQPLAERQRLLAGMLLPHPFVQAVPSYQSPAELFTAAQNKELEGIVCKDTTSIYTPGGKDKRWLKRKISRDLTAVAGGVTFRDGRVNALLLGLFDHEGKLHYIGHAGAGKLTMRDWQDLTELTPGLTALEMPFAASPERSKGAVWLKPQLVFKVNFLEWNASGTMRQPVLQARVDLPARSCSWSQKDT